LLTYEFILTIKGVSNFCYKGEFDEVVGITVVCLVFPFDSGILITKGE